ncbi:MAG: hypothetical protein HN523_04160 [Porticoccaceae bacterium]|nr:hypothetical protein [Porticoccaceae bacterium]
MKTIKKEAIVVMDGRIIKGFCISMVLLQFIFFGLVQSSVHHNPGYIPANLFLLLFSFCGGVGAIIGIGLCIKRKFNKISFGGEGLVIFLICLLSVLGVQLLYGWQSIDLSAGNDYSTDAINPPQFNQSKHDRLHSHQMPSFWRFMDIPHKVLKSDTDSLVLPMSGFDSKIMIKKAIYGLGWVFVRRLDDASASEGFNETYLLRAGNPGIAGRTDVAVRVVTNNEGFSVVDIHSSSSHSRRDLGFNELMILRLKNAILVLAGE